VTPLIYLLKKINDRVAIAVGAMLMVCVLYTLVEILTRQLGGSLGGVDEISGYVMAITSSWGVSYALTERAHVRIDLVRERLVSKSRALLDAIAIMSLAATALVVAWRGWSVVAKTLSTGARANTPLETPLWIPQLLWWSGWLWFAISAVLLVVYVMQKLFVSDEEAIEEAVGMGGSE